jgi:hypothetical protein
MSKSTVTAFVCPKCNRSSNFTIWQSVNVTLNPDLKDKLLTGELLLFICPFCKFSQKVGYSILYHDQKKEYMIWYLPANHKSQMQYDNRELRQVAKMMPNYTLRLVPSFDQLVEKIIIFEYGFDDRAMEILKHDYWSVALKKTGGNLEKLSFNCAHNIDNEAPNIEFIESTSNGEDRIYKLRDHKAYNLAVQKMVRDLHIPLTENAEWKVVDCYFLEQYQ